MHQAIPHFERQFPGLEMSAIFATNHPDFDYEEKGLLSTLWPTRAVVTVPIFERLPEEEEAKLGGAGIRKNPVGRIVLEGSCQYGCATVKLASIKVFTMENELKWEKAL
ncbi:hypothetical protein HDU96_007055 [Phlyctochytrium bullatum]|nr:hypothetical protein HDU96_007055 [Phlyctochytrium bullatum]